MKNKVTIIGAGGVGANTAYALLAREAASEVVLIDVNVDKALGEALDIHESCADHYDAHTITSGIFLQYSTNSGNNKE